MHEVGDAQETFAELSAGMEEREVLFLEAFTYEKRHRERVAERERGGRRGGWGEAEGAGFLGDRGGEVVIGALREGRRGIAGDGDDLGADRLMCGMSRTSSSVSPEFEIARTTSPRTIMPRSP